MNNEIKLIKIGKDFFEGTVEQFANCYFDNVNPLNIIGFGLQNDISVEIDNILIERKTSQKYKLTVTPSQIRIKLPIKKPNIDLAIKLIRIGKDLQGRHPFTLRGNVLNKEIRLFSKHNKTREIYKL